VPTDPESETNPRAEKKEEPKNPKQPLNGRAGLMSKDGDSQEVLGKVYGGRMWGEAKWEKNVIRP